MALPTRRERYFLYNGLVCLAQGLEGKYTTVDLRNESCVTGRIDQVDGFMNVSMADVVFTDTSGSEFAYDSFFVQARKIRYIHIPNERSKHRPRQFFKEDNNFLCRDFIHDATACNLGIGITNNSIINMSTMSDVAKITKKQKVSEMFRLSDYDCIGFDLDNTLLRYRVTNMVKLEYEVLSQYLVTEKGYSAKYLLQPFEADIDFLQKGLLVDFFNGNLIQSGIDGYVLKASHGTKFLSAKEIEEYYGPDRKWEISKEFSRNMLEAWNGPLSEKIRTLQDYFDMPSSLAFARIVDSLDAKCGSKQNMYNVWPDVLDGLINMFERAHFNANKGGYFPALKANPDKYIYKCSKTVMDWLRKIKETKTVFLITGSNVDFASLTASHAMGNDWKSLFDVVVCYARKPGFFTGSRPFLKVDGVTETDIVIKGSDLEFGSIYSQGNWKDLLQLLSRKNEQHPKCLYVGDNLIQDIYTPAEFTNCDTVAIVEELLAEGMVHGGDESHLDTQVLVSKCWGSYFYSKDDKISGNSIWDALIRKYSRICIPNLEVLANHPLDFEIDCFNNKEVGTQQMPLGYYPSRPASLLKQT